MRGVEPPPSMLWGSNPDARYGAPPFEGGASTCSAKHRCSPCLLVKGTDCAGVILACLRGWWSRSLASDLHRCPSPQKQRGVMGAGPIGYGSVLRTPLPRGFGGDVLPHIPAARAI